MQVGSLSACGITRAVEEIKVSADTLEFSLNKCPYTRVCSYSLRDALARCNACCSTALPCQCIRTAVQGSSVCSKHVDIASLAGHIQAQLCTVACFYVPCSVGVLKDKAAVAHSQL